MSDPEFSAPMQKSPGSYEEDSGRPRNSGLAVVSLVFGILGYPLLPLVGPIVAIVTGRIALGEIDASGGRLGGRGTARAGVILGYIWFVLALLAGAIILFFFTVRSQQYSTVQSTLASPAASPPRVKMANEMTSAELARLQRLGVIDEDVIIGFYEKPSTSGEGPEMATLTDRQVIYTKGDRMTVFDLKDVVNVLDNTQFQMQYHPNSVDLTHYDIEIKRKDGSRMRIMIVPYSEGPIFARGLLDAWKAAGGVPEDAGERK